MFTAYFWNGMLRQYIWAGDFDTIQAGIDRIMTELPRLKKSIKGEVRDSLNQVVWSSENEQKE